jgi:hypothetical protein
MKKVSTKSIQALFEGNAKVRAALVECSSILVATDPLRRTKYLKLKNVKGAKGAIITIARKLISRIKAMHLPNIP